MELVGPFQHQLMSERFKPKRWLAKFAAPTVTWIVYSAGVPRI